MNTQHINQIVSKIKHLSGSIVSAALEGSWIRIVYLHGKLMVKADIKYQEGDIIATMIGKVETQNLVNYLHDEGAILGTITPEGSAVEFLSMSLGNYTAAANVICHDNAPEFEDAPIPTIDVVLDQVESEVISEAALREIGLRGNGMPDEDLQKAIEYIKERKG